MNRLATISGMDRRSGRRLTGVDHLRQSITDILTTEIGSRVCNRTYGSDLPDHVDAPIDEATVQSLYAATAIALSTWYPDFAFSRIAVEQGETRASLNIILSGEEGATDGQPFTIAVPVTLYPTTLN